MYRHTIMFAAGLVLSFVQVLAAAEPTATDPPIARVLGRTIVQSDIPGRSVPRLYDYFAECVGRAPDANEKADLDRLVLPDRRESLTGFALVLAMDATRREIQERLPRELRGTGPDGVPVGDRQNAALKEACEKLIAEGDPEYAEQLAKGEGKRETEIVIRAHARFCARRLAESRPEILDSRFADCFSVAAVEACLRRCYEAGTGMKGHHGLVEDYIRGKLAGSPKTAPAGATPAPPPVTPGGVRPEGQ